MKLQKSISRRLRDKEYSKFQIAIPNNLISQLKWEAGDNLEGKTTPKGLLICKTEQKQRQERIDYEHFKDIVTRTLASVPEGCTWTELKLKAGLTQVTPSPIWVKMMKDEGILKRFPELGTSRIIWKLSEERSIPNGLTLNHWLAATER